MGFFRLFFRPNVSWAKEYHMTLLQRFLDCTQHHRWAFLVSGGPSPLGPPVSALPACVPEPAAQAPEPPNTPCSFFPFFCGSSPAMKLPRPSFSCEDDSFPHNPSYHFRSVFVFYHHAKNHLGLGGLTQCICYLGSRSLGVRHWLIQVLCSWALHRAVVKLWVIWRLDCKKNLL